MNPVAYPQFAEFLRELAPYVVVCGSYARREETMHSDIDCFLRSRPRDRVDLEAAVNNETYMPEVLSIIERYGWYSDSVCIGHIAVERQDDVPRMVEVSCHYHIRHTEPIFVREIFGIPLLCAMDDKDAPMEDLYDAAVWDDETGDMMIKFPVPDYAKIVKSQA